MAASCAFTFMPRKRGFPSVLTSAMRMKTASWLPGRRSLFQGVRRCSVHQTTSEPTEISILPGHRMEEREDEPQFHMPVSHQSAEQQSLLLARPSDPPKDSRISRVAIIGTPNSGKSTLINSLLGRRICAVSQKVHTTMRKALAVITHSNTQVILLDTPGVVNFKQGRRHKLSRSLLVDAKNTLLESDLVAVMVDVSNKWTNMKLDPEILVQLHQHRHIPSILVLNKVDAIENKQHLFEITETLTEGIVDGKEIVLPKWKDKTKKPVTDILDSERMEERDGDEEKVVVRRRINEITRYAASKEAVDLGREESVSSNGSGKVLLDYSSINNNAAEELTMTSASHHDEDQNRLHIQDHDRHDDSKAELANIHPSTNQTQQGKQNHMIDHVTEDIGQVIDDMNQVTEDNTVQSNDLSSVDAAKRDVLLQYTANLSELEENMHDGSSKRGMDAEMKENDVENAERMEEERREMERQHEERRKLWRQVKERNGWPGFKAVYMISALNHDGVNDLRDFLLKNAQPGDWEYHEDVVTNLSPEDIVREAIREKLLETLPQEVPYNISQMTELWTTLEGGDLHIVQSLICHKKSHVRMLEKKLAWIGRQATQDLMDAFHCDVKLSLHVKFQK